MQYKSTLYRHLTNMHALSLAVFAVVLAMASAGAIGLIGPAGHGAALQGPGSHTAIIGPDGSHISAGTHGGGVAAAGPHGGVVSAAIAPGHIGLGGVVGLGGIGLGGVGLGGVGLGGVGLGGIGLGGIGIGSGHEGQYIPSGLERLHDDGSYRPEHHLAGLWH